MSADEVTQQALPAIPEPGDEGPIKVGAWAQMAQGGPAVLLVLGDRRLLLGAEDVRQLALRMLDEVQVAAMMDAMQRIGLADKTIVRAVKASEAGRR